MRKHITCFDLYPWVLNEEFDNDNGDIGYDIRSTRRWVEIISEDEAGLLGGPMLLPMTECMVACGSALAVGDAGRRSISRAIRLPTFNVERLR